MFELGQGFRVSRRGRKGGFCRACKVRHAAPWTGLTPGTAFALESLRHLVEIHEGQPKRIMRSAAEAASRSRSPKPLSFPLRVKRSPVVQ